MTNIVPTDFKQLQPLYQEDEVSLLDLWMVLVKRKMVILGVFFALFLVVLAFVMVVEPVFESRSVIRIGYVGELGNLEPPKVVVRRIIEDYRVDDSTEGERDYPLINSVSMGKGGDDLVTITAHGHSAKEANEYLSGVVDKLINNHKAVYNNALGQQRTMLQTLDARMQEARQQISELNKRFEAVVASDAATAAVLSQEKSSLWSSMYQLEQRRSEVMLSMSELKAMPTQAIRLATLPEKPVMPKPLLYLSLAVVVGSILGMFAAFMVEFLVNAREQMQQVANK